MAQNRTLTLPTVYRFSTFISIAAAVSMPLIGCASGPKTQTYISSPVAMSIPAVGVEARAEIGQTIISKAYVTRIPAIILLSDVSEAVHSAGTTTVRAGSIPLSVTSADGKFYRDERATYSMLGTPVSAHAGVFVPNDKSQSPVMFHYAMGYILGKTPVPITGDTTIERWAQGSFKRELVYSGVSQNTISILYREFSDNLARPAFSQELKYDLSQGATIGYKGARFEVMKATNTELTYKVARPLD